MHYLALNPLEENDIDEIVLAFKQLGWHKPRSLYESYLQDQCNNSRFVIVAKVSGKFAGYVTLKWQSDHSFFNQNNIPEIVDLNVLPDFRKHGIPTKLIHRCEQMAKENNHTQIGLGVGLTADYGSVQRLYVRLDYLPDGHGIHYHCQ